MTCSVRNTFLRSGEASLRALLGSKEEVGADSEDISDVTTSRGDGRVDVMVELGERGSSSHTLQRSSGVNEVFFFYFIMISLGLCEPGILTMCPGC